jgi:hypothetical protein
LNPVVLPHPQPELQSIQQFIQSATPHYDRLVVEGDYIENAFS